jgi:hypothetical protein
MKKEIIILVLAVVLLINLASASITYSCSNGTRIYESSKEIKEGGKKLVEGINIALIESDEVTAMSKILAVIMIDAEEVSLSNLTSSQDIILRSGTYTLDIVNATEDQATIRVDGVSGKLEEKEIKEINGLEIFLKNTQGIYPGIANVEIIAGSYITALSSDEKPFESVSINDTNYAIELTSASDSDATIAVRRCENSEIIRKENANKLPVQNTTPYMNNSANITSNITNIHQNNTANNTATQKKECNIAGSLKENRYCNETGQYVDKKEENTGCINNYECISEKCKSEKCVSNGFFARIWGWFAGIFS